MTVETAALAAQIVSAYVINNRVPFDRLEGLIRSTMSVLRSMPDSSDIAPKRPPPEPTPVIHPTQTTAIADALKIAAHAKPDNTLPLSANAAAYVAVAPFLERSTKITRAKAAKEKPERRHHKFKARPPEVTGRKTLLHGRNGAAK